MEQRIYAPGIGMHIACISKYAGGPHIRLSADPLYDWIPGCWDRRQREGMQANTRLLNERRGGREFRPRGARHTRLQIRVCEAANANS